MEQGEVEGGVGLAEGRDQASDVSPDTAGHGGEELVG
jgi:hypothetical protein